MIEIIPSILVKSKEEWLEKLLVVEGQVTRVHLDIADGIFVPNITIDGVKEMEEIVTSLKVSVHLMVSHPENHIGRWLNTSVNQITFHLESTRKALEVIGLIKEGEREAGVALNPSTEISALKEIIDEVDFVHFMTVEPGFYGGQFVEKVVEKISDFHYFYPDKPVVVDGGINPARAKDLVRVGASQLVVGSYLWQSKNFAQALEEFKKVLE